MKNNLFISLCASVCPSGKSICRGNTRVNKNHSWRTIINFFSLMSLTTSPLMAQVAPALLLNDTRTFEVTACIPSKENMISVWMERRPSRKDNNESAADMQVAYKSSTNSGKDWSAKQVIDIPSMFTTGNPYLTSNSNGETYLACMHVGQDFFSGNISLYKFDFKKKQFLLKSIPFTSEDRLLDKPSMVTNGNEIHLVYVAYTKNFKNAVKYQRSADGGKTWSKPTNVFEEGRIRYLGPSIVLSKQKQVIISSGSYGSNIYMVKKKNVADSTVFEKPIMVSKVSENLGSAMTELVNSEGKLILTWQNPHQRNETWMSFSTDEGEIWSKPFILCDKGNLLSSVFDKQGNIHCIYSDFGEQKFSVRYKQLNTKYEILKDDVLIKPLALGTFDEYLGAYQKLLIQKNELFAFWIDYPNNSSLNLTKWKF